MLKTYLYSLNLNRRCKVINLFAIKKHQNRYDLILI